MPGGSSGRVRLADLHKAALDGTGVFGESAEYLRAAGALDEDSNPAVPEVIMPNYINSPSNCLGTTSFFDMCCPNECDQILEVFEKAVAAPQAGLSEILAVASSLPAERELSGGFPAP